MKLINTNFGAFNQKIAICFYDDMSPYFNLRFKKGSNSDMRYFNKATFEESLYSFMKGYRFQVCDIENGQQLRKFIQNTALFDRVLFCNKSLLGLKTSNVKIIKEIQRIECKASYGHIFIADDLLLRHYQNEISLQHNIKDYGFYTGRVCTDKMLKLKRGIENSTNVNLLVCKNKKKCLKYDAAIDATRLFKGKSSDVVNFLKYPSEQMFFRNYLKSSIF